MPKFQTGHHPVHDMAAAARKAKTPWRTKGLPWLCGCAPKRERIDAALKLPRNKAMP